MIGCPQEIVFEAQSIQKRAKVLGSRESQSDGPLVPLAVCSASIAVKGGGRSLSTAPKRDGDANHERAEQAQCSSLLDPFMRNIQTKEDVIAT